MKWERHLVKVFLYEDIIASKDRDDKRLVSTFRKDRKGCCGPCRDKFDFYWYTYLKGFISWVAALIITLFAVLIFIGETTNFLSRIPFFGRNISIFEAFDTKYAFFYRTQVLCMIPLFFLMLFVFHSLFSLKVNGYLGLYP